MKRHTVLALIVVSITLPLAWISVQARSHPKNWAKVPSSWYILPEKGSLSAQENGDEENPEESLTPVLRKIIDVHEKALRHTKPLDSHPAPGPLPAKDWVPWHLGFFATDLGITSQGLLGILTYRSLPAIEIYWARQGPTPSPQHMLSIDRPPTTSSSSVHVSDATTEEDIRIQIEPLVQTAIASGKVKNIPGFRNQIQKTVTELVYLVQSIQSQPNTPWWFSKFRFDFSVDVSGRVLPVMQVGGDLRFRIEWARLKPVHGPISISSTRDSAPSIAAVHSGLEPFHQGLRNFVGSMEHILEEASSKQVYSGFQAYTFRVGIGLTASGTIGIVKGTGTALGHIYFSREMTPPTIYPGTDPNPKKDDPKEPDHNPSDSHTLQAQSQPKDYSNENIYLIEQNPDSSHLQFAQKKGINFGLSRGLHSNAVSQVAYEISPKRLQKGIQKAISIGAFFTKHATKSPRSAWKIYQIKADFDASLSGEFGLVGAGGAISAQICYFNENF